MRTIAVIPSRYASTRFPGKPLADICGRPMIWWIYQEARKVKEFDDIIVATESDKIVRVCDSYGMKSVITSDEHLTGTDRVAEVAQKVDADLYVIIMGDEPLIHAEDERRLIQSIDNAQEADAVMLTECFTEPVDLANMTTIKLAINDYGELIFMSRAAIPYPKDAIGYKFYKNVGCYALKKNALDFFLNTKPGNIERAEGIELLRLIENHKKIITVPIESKSMAVDTPKDLERIRAVLSEDKEKMKILEGWV